MYSSNQIIIHYITFDWKNVNINIEIIINVIFFIY